MAIAAPTAPGSGMWVAREVALGKLIRAHREVHGLTQPEAAHLLGVSAGNLKRWEKGEREDGTPATALLYALVSLAESGPLQSDRRTLKTARRLCELYHTTPEQLLERSSTMRTWVTPYGDSLSA